MSPNWVQNPNWVLNQNWTTTPTTFSVFAAPQFTDPSLTAAETEAEVDPCAGVECLNHGKILNIGSGKRGFIGGEGGGREGRFGY